MLLVLLLILAAVLGDSVNYAVGRWIGPRVFRFEDSWLFKRAYLERTHRYFEKYGGRTIVITRFVPIVRTYAPVRSGHRRHELLALLAVQRGGAVLWVAGLTYAGYFFGNVPLVKNNLSLVILGIIVLSISPAIIEVARHKLQAQGSAR